MCRNRVNAWLLAAGVLMSTSLTTQAFAAPPLSPAERDALHARIQSWESLTPQARQAAREQLQAWRQLPPLRQAELRAAAAAFAQLPPQQQAALRVKFAALPGVEQHGWLLGPALGPYYPRLHPLIAYVPSAQRAPLLRTLHAMSPQELELLGRIAFSTPPAERDALRQALIRQLPADRLGWLMMQMER